MKSYFASPERDSQEQVLKSAEKLEGLVPISWLNRLPMCIVILNQHRQILYSNDAFQVLTQKERKDIAGLRPGEALECVHAKEVQAGCGCSRFCDVCGAARAIVKSLEAVSKDCQNCRMRRLLGDTEVPLDLQVFSEPLDIEGNKLVMLTIMDISHELRLRYLERTFFHGLVNTAGGIASLTSIMERHEEDNVITPLLADCSKRILRDVLYHRDLSAAEQDRLTIEMQTIDTENFLTRLIEEECAIRNLQPSLVDFSFTCRSFTSDKRILGHVLRQMLENAMEACETCSSPVNLTCVNEPDGSVLITMRNQGEIPTKIQKQIFKRYISTKDDDRGLGTYVIKTLAEKYLGGDISFVSGEGYTTFVLRLP